MLTCTILSTCMCACVHARRLQYSQLVCEVKKHVCGRVWLGRSFLNITGWVSASSVQGEATVCLQLPVISRQSRANTQTQALFFFIIYYEIWLRIPCSLLFLAFLFLFFFCYIYPPPSLATLDISHSPQYQNVIFDLVDIHGLKNKTVKYFELRTKRLKSGLR